MLHDDDAHWPLVMLTDLARRLLSARRNLAMSLSPWMVAGGGVVVVMLATLRWEFADFVLDRISVSALADWMRGRHSQDDIT